MTRADALMRTNHSLSEDRAGTVRDEQADRDLERERLLFGGFDLSLDVVPAGRAIASWIFHL